MVTKKLSFDEWLAVPLKDKEILLIQAFLAVAQKSGVELVTLEKVAKKAKTAVSTVHYHFGKSERALIDGALRYVAREASAYLEQTFKAARSHGNNLVKAYVDAKFSWITDQPSYSGIWVFFLYLTTQDECYRAYSEQLRSSTEVGIEGLILQEIGKGTYRKPASVPVLASQIEQIVFGGTLSAITSTADEKIRSRLQKQTWTMVERMLLASH